MTRTFIQTKEFSRNWDDLGFDEEDLRVLELDIMKNPDKYSVMSGTGALEVSNMSDNRVFNSIMTGLNEALEDAQSEKPILKRHKIVVEPVKIYEAAEVKKIRNSTGMSQKSFASYIGVSDKTVEAWEAGINHPSGAASRLLRMMEMDKDLVIRFPFVKNAIAK